MNSKSVFHLDHNGVEMQCTFVSILIETPKGVYLVVPTVGDGRVDQASGSLAASPCDLWFVRIVHCSYSF